VFGLVSRKRKSSASLLKVESIRDGKGRRLCPVWAGTTGGRRQAAQRGKEHAEVRVPKMFLHVAFCLLEEADL